METTTQQQLKHFFINRQITKKELPNILYPNQIKPSTYKDFLHGEEWVSALGNNLLANNEIFIIGDYDADGVLSATVVNQALKALLKPQFRSEIHMLERTRLSGYGLHNSDLNYISQYLQEKHKDKATIIILDNGVGTYPEYDYLNNKINDGVKYTVLVADHHEQNNNDNYDEHYFKKYHQQPLINPIIVDPFLNDEDDFTYQGLSATGLSYVLMEGLNQWIKNFKIQHNIKNTSTTLTQDKLNLLKTYAGISIVTDSCSMLGENRYYVTFAIDYLNKYWEQVFNKNNNPLITFCCMIEEQQRIYSIDEKFFGWTLGPIINAVSRLNGSCKIAQDIFNSDNIKSEEQSIIKAIDLNNERKATVNKLSNALINKLSQQNVQTSVIINLKEYLPNTDWSNYPGLIGLIANNIMTTFQLPTLLLAPNRNNSALTGSARTPEFSKLFHSMFVVKDNFDLEFGGHREAFGVSYLPFEQLNDFRNAVNNVLLGNDPTAGTFDKKLPTINKPKYDYNFNDYNQELHEYLKVLAPFGQSFEAPVYYANIPINTVNIEYFGSNNQHVRLIINDSEFIQWNSALVWQQLLKQHFNDSVDIFASAENHEWNNNIKVQFIIDRVSISSNNDEGLIM